MIRFAAIALLLGVATVAPAQDAGDVARIGSAAMAATSGRIATNQAAGESNAQANVAVVAASGTGVVLASAAIHQDAQHAAAAHGRTAQATIGAGALRDGNGLLTLNQAAGSGNTQLNLFVLESGPVAATVDDGALAKNAGSQPPEWTGEASASRREARIDGGVLAGSVGVVQVNQSAGVGNSVANVIALRLSGAGASR